jgi:Holliday junction resolvase RusA-like endonuclease
MWSEHWNRVHEITRNQMAYEYEIPIAPQPKERARGGRTPIKTRTWEQVVSEGVSAQLPAVPPAGRIGLEVLFLINSKTPPRHDISNAIKTLEDALNRRAYVDDNQIDYLSGLRIWSPNVQNRIEARVYEL